MPIGGSWAGDVGRRVDIILTSGKPTQRGSVGARVARWLKRQSVHTDVTALVTDACGGEIGEEWRSSYRDAREAPRLHLQPLRNEYLNCVDSAWRRASAPMVPIRWSSGVVLISLALGMCESVDVYGFWPFGTDVNGQRVPYHYDEDPAVLPRPTQKEGLRSHLHDWETEWRLLNATSGVRMHVDGCA